jgi:hypothetical protein
MKKVLISSDCLLDVLEKQEPNYKAVAHILSWAKKIKLKVFFSSFGLHTVYLKVRKEFNEKEAVQILQKLSELGKIAYPDEKTFKKVFQTSGNEFEMAMELQVAIDSHMDFFVTNQINEVKSHKMNVVNADQLLSINV